jgi:hypothetical protein
MSVASRVTRPMRGTGAGGTATGEASRTEGFGGVAAGGAAGDPLIARRFHHEFWPAWLFYAPVVPYIGWLALRHGAMTWTCCNPEIDPGGGIVGESKHRILGDLPAWASDVVLRTHMIKAGTDAPARARRAVELIEDGDLALGYPAILKPDSAQRGFGVRVVRGREDVEPYFRIHSCDVVAQRYHPGPEECGVFWMRRRPADTVGAEPTDGSTGFIYSITRKTFPWVIGDGRRTLRELVESHARLSRQASVFHRRHATRWNIAPAAGEKVRLAEAGNHCQGTLFSDGSDLITPALSGVIDRLASGFAADRRAGGGLDFGRFDLRYSSDEDLRAGRGLAIIELNGVTSESTNLYDPSRSTLWAYRTLMGQWRNLFELGAWRRRSGGVDAMSLWFLARLIREFYRGRPAAEVSD